MSNSDNYSARVRPQPELIDGKVYWGWSVDLTDKSTDKVYPFSGVASHEDADSAIQEGAKSMLLWMQALAVVKDKGISEINLDAPLPEPEPEAQPEEENPEAEEKPAEETPEAEKPAAETAAE